MILLYAQLVSTRGVASELAGIDGIYASTGEAIPTDPVANGLHLA